MIDQPPKPPPGFRGQFTPMTKLEAIELKLEEVRRQMEEDRKPGPVTTMLLARKARVRP